MRNTRGRTVICSLHANRCLDGKGVTLVRNFVVFIFCWACYRGRNAECQQMMAEIAGAEKPLTSINGGRGESPEPLERPTSRSSLKARRLRAAAR